MTDTAYSIDFDVAVVAPLRGRGSVKRSTAALLSTVTDAGLTTLVIDSTDTTVRQAFRRTAATEIMRLLSSPLVQLAGPGHQGRAQLVVVLHAEASRPPAKLRSAVHAANAVIVASRPRPTAESPFADVAAPPMDADSFVSREPWIDELETQVRVATQAESVNWAAMTSSDFRWLADQGLTGTAGGPWPSGINSGALATTPRTGPAEGRIRAGRHIVTTEPVWPKNIWAITRHLPGAEQWDVRIFGPHARLVRQVEVIPSNWSLHTVAGPRDLAQLDFWVAVTTDSQQILADPAVHEAFAAGLVVILPPKDELRAAFGDAAVYADATGVRGQITFLTGQGDQYERQSARALAFAESNSADRLMGRLTESGVQGPLAPRPEPVPRPSPRSGRRRFRLALVTSNGAGMGHLTRLLAIARRLPSDIEPVFISLSQAVDVVASFGYTYSYIASKAETGLSAGEWNAYCEARFTEELNRLTPDALVFDGTWPYRGLTTAARQTGTPMIWSRRGMWRTSAGDRSLAHSKLFDLIVEPGEFAAEADRGATTRVADARRVDPVTVLSREELLPRDEARRRLGIDSEQNVVLVTLGAGNLNDINTTTTDVIEACKEHLPTWRILLTSNPLSMADSSYDGVEAVQIYPIAEYANAFDLTVSATGYNSFHEWISACVPTLWMPNTSTQTDDQVARGRFAEEAGIGLSLEDPTRGQIFDAVCRLAIPGNIEQMRRTLEARQPANGAAAAAALITRQITEGQVTDD